MSASPTVSIFPKRGDGGRRLERGRATNRLQHHRLIVRADETNQLGAVASSQATGRDLEEHLELGILAATDPAENCLQCSRLQYTEQLVELMLWGAKGRILERLEQLSQRLRIAHDFVQLGETLLLCFQHFVGAVGGYARFAQEIGGVAVLRGGEEDQQEIVEEAADLFANSRIFLVLECVEERCDHRRPQVRRELTLYLSLQIFDLAVVEEVQRRVEVIELGERGLSRLEARFGLGR